MGERAKAIADARSKAMAAALEWKKLTDAGDQRSAKEAKKKAREALKFEALWRKLGGEGPLF